MSGKSIPPPPSGGSRSDASMTKIEPIPPRGEAGAIGEKKDFRAPSSRRSSPMGGSASRPKARSAGSLPSPTAGTAPTMRRSSSGAASPSQWSDAPRAQSAAKAEIRSYLRVYRTSRLPSPRGTRAKACPSWLLPIHSVRGSTSASPRPRSQNTATHSRSRRPPRFVVVL